MDHSAECAFGRCQGDDTAIPMGDDIAAGDILDRLDFRVSDVIDGYVDRLSHQTQMQRDARFLK
ncbi:MAG TPA: DUF2117 domain-containing protein [Methanotrichaceae archaeon]|nr:DUF2117 domain-containing protein [Methanotrichaceae archaeon]